MAGSTKNFHLVLAADQPYFLRATVAGLRQQLSNLGLPTSGLKVDLYLRLRNGGHRLYTDDRHQSSSDSDQSDSDQSDSDQSDSVGSGSDGSGSVGSGGDGSDSDGSGSVGSGSVGSGSDGSGSVGSGGDGSGSVGSGGDGSSSVGSGGDQPGDDQGNDDHGDDDQGNDDQGGPPPGGSAQKRPRDDDDGDGNGDDQGPPPPRKIPRVGGAFPVEVRLQLVPNLNFATLWNLAMAAPAGYLADDMNVFILDARRQWAIDYPDGEDPEDYDPFIPNRPLSMLEWVGRRLVYDPEFGRTWRARILQLVDTYIQEYTQASHPHDNLGGVEMMLHYLNPNQELYDFPLALVEAVGAARPDIVHLLLLRGADPNYLFVGGRGMNSLFHAIPRGTPIDTGPSGSEAMQTIFALIGAGADVTMVGDAERQTARNALAQIMDLPDPGWEASHDWPRIVNARGLGVREFIADPRSDYFDRMRLALYVIYTGQMAYPGFVQ